MSHTKWSRLQVQSTERDGMGNFRQESVVIYSKTVIKLYQSLTFIDYFLCAKICAKNFSQITSVLSTQMNIINILIFTDEGTDIHADYGSSPRLETSKQQSQDSNQRGLPLEPMPLIEMLMLTFPLIAYVMRCVMRYITLQLCFKSFHVWRWQRGKIGRVFYREDVFNKYF